MNARIHDPLGSAAARLRFAALGLLIGALGSAVVPGMLGLPALLMGFALMHVGLFISRRPRPLAGELTLGAGFVELRGPGGKRLRGSRIHARDIVGASTARLGDGVALALTRRSRRYTTTTLALASEADAKIVREALGIGHDGFGNLLYRTRRPTTSTTAAGFGVVATAVSVAWALALRSSPDDATLLHPMLFLTYCIVPAVVTTGFVGLFRSTLLERPPCIVLVAEGVWIYAAGWSFVPYLSIVGADVEPKGIVIRHRTPPGVELSSVKTPLLSLDERESVVAQTLSATERARGHVMPRAETGRRLEWLRKGASTSRDWFARLDALASSLESTGYRAISVDRADLGAVLSDPDEDGDLRVAAARILSRTDATAKDRALAMAEATRDEQTSRRIRIAVEREDAGAEIDALEESESGATELRAARLR